MHMNGSVIGKANKEGTIYMMTTALGRIWGKQMNKLFPTIQEILTSDVYRHEAHWMGTRIMD